MSLDVLFATQKMSCADSPTSMNRTSCLSLMLLCPQLGAKSQFCSQAFPVVASQGCYKSQWPKRIF
jgi:hypothetical protein